MSERFEDMVLTAGLPDGDSGILMSGRGLRTLYEAQHAADMAHEVACPLLITGLSDREVVCIATDGSDSWYGHCPLCSSTGRVTLGRIVEADRERST